MEDQFCGTKQDVWEDKSPETLLKKLKEVLDNNSDQIQKLSDLKAINGTLYVYLQKYTEWTPAVCCEKVGYGNLVKSRRIRGFEDIEKMLADLNPDMELIEVSPPGTGRLAIRFKCLKSGCGFISTWTIWSNIEAHGYGCKRCSKKEPITNEMHDERLKVFFGGKIVRKGPIMNAKTKVEHECIVHKEIFSIVPYSIAPPVGSNYKARNGCPQCNPHYPLDNEIHDQRLHKYFNGTVRRTGYVVNSVTPIAHECLVCGHEFLAAPQNITPLDERNAKGCPQCAGRGQVSDENHNKRLQHWHNGNIVRVETTVDAKTPILHQCVLCDFFWKVSPNKVAPPESAISATGCPYCNEPRSAMGLKGEEIVFRLLQDIEINVCKGLSEELRDKMRAIDDKKRIVPDFSAGSKRLIDCKLSIGAVFMKDHYGRTTQERYGWLTKVRFIVIEPWKNMKKRIIKRGDSSILHVSIFLNRLKSAGLRSQYLKEFVSVLELDKRNPSVIEEFKRSVIL